MAAKTVWPDDVSYKIRSEGSQNRHFPEEPWNTYLNPKAYIQKLPLLSSIPSVPVGWRLFGESPL